MSGVHRDVRTSVNTLWAERKAAALRLLASGLPAAAVARHPSVSCAPSTMSKWIKHFIDQGRLVENHSAMKLHPTIKVYGPRGVNTNLHGGANAAMPAPAITDPARLACDGTEWRPHNETYLGRLEAHPRVPPDDWGLLVQNEWECRGAHFYELDLGQGWTGRFTLGRKKASLMLREPNMIWHGTTVLEFEVAGRDQDAWNRWRSFCIAVGAGGGALLRQGDQRHIGTPLKDHVVARWAGLEVETDQGRMWVDRSDHGVVPGAVELEGDTDLMYSLAYLPKRVERLEVLLLTQIDALEKVLEKLIAYGDNRGPDEPMLPDSMRDVA